MDEWGWEQLRPWLEHRSQVPIGALFCVINGPTCGRPWSSPAARTLLLHADLGVRSVYLQGIDNTGVISVVRSHRAPVMPASAGLLL